MSRVRTSVLLAATAAVAGAALSMASEAFVVAEREALREHGGFCYHRARVAKRDAYCEANKKIVLPPQWHVEWELADGGRLITHDKRTYLLVKKGGRYELEVFDHWVVANIRKDGKGPWVHTGEAYKSLREGL